MCITLIQNVYYNLVQHLHISYPALAFPAVDFQHWIWMNMIFYISVRVSADRFLTYLKPLNFIYYFNSSEIHTFSL